MAETRMVAVPGDRPEIAALATELARLPAEIAHAALRSLDELGGPDHLDAQLWGDDPSDDQVLAASIRGAYRVERARSEVLGDSLTREQAAQRLGVGPQQVSRLVSEQELVALEVGRELRLPCWQFHPDTPKGRLEGVGRVAHAYAGGPVTLSRWMSRPNPALARRTPATALRDGDLDAVVAAAESGA